MEQRALSSLVSLWPVVLGTVMLGFTLAYMIEPTPVVGEAQATSVTVVR